MTDFQTGLIVGVVSTFAFSFVFSVLRDSYRERTRNRRLVKFFSSLMDGQVRITNKDSDGDIGRVIGVGKDDVVLADMYGPGSVTRYQFAMIGDARAVSLPGSTMVRPRWMEQLAIDEGTRSHGKQLLQTWMNQKPSEMLFHQVKEAEAAFARASDYDTADRLKQIAASIKARLDEPSVHTVEC